MHRPWGGRERVSMSIIPTSDLERYRQIVASVNVSPERKDEMIAIIYQMMRHFTDIAFGLSDAQIISTMQQRQVSAGSPDHARIAFNASNELDGLVNEDEINTPNPSGTGHGHHDTAPGCHLLPG